MKSKITQKCDFQNGKRVGPSSSLQSLQKKSSNIFQQPMLKIRVHFYTNLDNP